MQSHFDILNQFEPISLAEMDRVALMDRIDSKYVFHLNELASFLDEIKDQYAVLEINNHRISKYESLYFDTPNFDLYHFHQRGKFNRFKFRIRKYVESNLLFFEVKFKNNKGRTKKNRIVNQDFTMQSNEQMTEFLQKYTHYTEKDLEQKIWVNYSRITLVNREIEERVTLDLDLTFIDGNHSESMSEFVVAEVKQNKSSHSAFVELMHKNHIREGSVSKYCLGVMNLFPHMKSNNFKPFQINLNKIAKIYS
jgi:hypothetical protein